MSDDEDESVSDGPREASASFAGACVLKLLGTLRSAKHAGRIKALKKFQDYIDKYRPELYDDDVELLLVGSPSLDGLIPWCGYKSHKGEDVLKTTAKGVLQLVHWLVSLGSDNLFAEKFMDLGADDLHKMELAMHIKVASADDNEPFELLSLLLTRRTGAPLELDQVLPDADARAKFTRWLQQSATEHQLMDKLQERASSLAAAAAAAQATTAVPQPRGALSAAHEAVRSLDPLGLHHMDLMSTQDLSRSKAMAPQPAGPRSTASLLAAKERINLLQKLQQAPFAGSAGGVAGRSDSGTSGQKTRYTRDRSRAAKSTTEAEGRVSAVGTSIVPQDDNFDPILFLMVVHGSSGFEDLLKGQANLEKAMGTQANQLQQLVRQHYDSFIRCADGIHWFKNMIGEEFIRPESAKGGKDATKIGQLLDIVTATQEGSRSLFLPLLERIDKMRGLRSARLMLQRLAKVLDVPGRMAKFMRVGQYEEVVREYERVCTLPVGGGVHLLSRVQEQAEVVAQELRSKLKTYLALEAHPFEDLLEATDLLGRLGGMQEPLLYCLFAQAQLWHHELDDLDAWCSRSTEMVLSGGSGEVGNEEEEEDDGDDDDGDDGAEEALKKGKASKPRHALMSPDGAPDEDSDAESDFSLEDGVSDRLGLVGNTALDFSVSYVLGSVEHEASVLRLNYVRRLVKEARRFLPTLLKLATLVTEDLSGLKIIWQPGQYTYSVVAKTEEKDAVTRFNEPLPSERAASAAALTLLESFMRRLCDASRQAMFGSGATTASAPSEEAVTTKPLDPAYFREGLKVVSELYDEIYRLEGDLGLTLVKAVIPPLKTVVDDAQGRQIQSVLDRIAVEMQRLIRQDAEGCGTKSRNAVGGASLACIGHQSSKPTAAGEYMVEPKHVGGNETGLPKAWCELLHVALEDLASSLVRPFWCAAQVTKGLTTIIGTFLNDALSLDCAEAPAGTTTEGVDNGPKPLLATAFPVLGQKAAVRALALIVYCIQLDAKYVPLVVEDARRLFDADLPGEQFSPQISKLHDKLLQAYLERTSSEIVAGIKSGWTLKHKGVRVNGTLGLAIPGYVVHVLLCLVRSKAEIRDELGEMLVLGVDDEVTYLERTMLHLATAAMRCLQAEANELSEGLQQLLLTPSPESTKVVGQTAHLAQVELDFLLSSTFRRLLPGEQFQALKSSVASLKRLAAEMDEDEESERILEYNPEALHRQTKMYVASIG